MLADGCASLGPLLRASCVGGGSAAAVNGTSVPGGGVAKGSTDFLQRDSMTVPPPGPRALAGIGTLITLVTRTVILGVIVGKLAQTEVLFGKLARRFGKGGGVFFSFDSCPGGCTLICA